MRSIKPFLTLLLALALLCSPALATADGEESGAEAQAEQKAEPESTEDAADLAKLSLSIARPTSLTFSDGAYVVDLTQTQSLTLKWQYSAAAHGYKLRVTNASSLPLFETDQVKKKLTLSLNGFAPGAYTVSVTAVCADAPAAMAQLSLRLTQGEGGGSRGGSGGGGARGGSAGSEHGQQETQGFQVTPGKALTSTHDTGNRDMSLYGAAVLAFDGETPLTALAPTDQTAPITLDGDGAFTAVLEDDTLTFTPLSKAECWTVNGYTLKILSCSGVKTLRLGLDEGFVDFACRVALTGEIYARLCAAGLVSRDYDYAIRADATLVRVDGAIYALRPDGALEMTEGQ